MGISRTALGSISDSSIAKTAHCSGGHRMGFWHEPFQLEKFVKFSETNEYRTMIQLVQCRCCVDCGEAEMRVVK